MNGNTKSFSENSLIDVRNVVKRFKNTIAVDNLSLQIQKGEFVALLGPNGAGKTTLIEMLEGIQKPDAGSISILGTTWKENETFLRSKVGLALQETRFMDRITVRETLNLFGTFYKVKTEVERNSRVDRSGRETKHLCKQSFGRSKTKIGSRGFYIKLS